MDKLVIKESSVSLVKSIFSAVPYFGGLLNEVAFDWRSRIKQERINRFAVMLGEYFGHNPEINREILTSEDFSDLFEAVLKRVAQTKSNEKHKRFRDILTDFIEHPTRDLDNASIFLDLVNDLDETAIKILKHHRVFNKDFVAAQAELYQINESLSELAEKLKKEQAILANGNANDADRIADQINVAGSKQRHLQDEIAKMEKYRKAEFYGLTEDKFLFYKQVLQAKGLLSDNFIGSTVGGRPYVYMRISEFGEQFVAFILTGR